MKLRAALPLAFFGLITACAQGQQVDKLRPPSLERPQASSIKKPQSAISQVLSSKGEAAAPLGDEARWISLSLDDLSNDRRQLASLALNDWSLEQFGERWASRDVCAASQDCGMSPSRSNPVLAQSGSGAEPSAPNGNSSGNQDLNTVSKKQINPVSDLWSMVSQHDSTMLDDDGKPFKDTEWTHSLKFQPVLPLELTDKISLPGPDDGLRFIGRPLFPLVQSNPIPQAGGDAKQETAFGDIQMATIISPAKKGADGLFWGFGASWRFPTATDDDVGQEQFALGPGAVAFYFDDPWIFGLFPQQQFRVSGGSSRDNINQLNLQYFILRDIAPGWKVGMTPNIIANWDADSDDRWTVPVGLAATTVVPIGGFPTRFLFEVQGFPVQPDTAEPLVNFRLVIAPVIVKPSWAQKPLF